MQLRNGQSPKDLFGTVRGGTLYGVLAVMSTLCGRCYSAAARIWRLFDLALKVLTLYQIWYLVIIIVALLLVTTFFLLQVLV